MNDREGGLHECYVFPSGANWESVKEIPRGYQIAPKIEKQNHEAITASAPIVLMADNPRERMNEITDKLEAGIKGIFESEQYKTYLASLFSLLKKSALCGQFFYLLLV